MAVVHRTTMTPTKLELLQTWLPAQPWYAGERPDPAKAGGFRLDDPQGEVGIEFMVVTDGAAAYHVPLTYRGAPLEGARDARSSARPSTASWGSGGCTTGPATRSWSVNCSPCSWGRPNRSSRA
ncbi:maltokinase N-terminal cap-like domain-containing protein [Nocardiopsis changdeensis]|uniref:maltokinase N-terminal cap-like domain-containing protein n=1 Tax=Nocardiopsis changdeensis TaxID=2831969 RepID=UPI003F46A358